ncbi:hypothetical protein Fot_28065 [Forsythia ovata]|uniref:AT-hook motif nuclear-localized protein n=1 Tax=Forsythia ovata TaxID=205694 RepID=A0ABD1TMY1_9LAMI
MEIINKLIDQVVSCNYNKPTPACHFKILASGPAFSSTQLRSLQHPKAQDKAWVVVDNTSPPPLVLSVASVPGVTILQTPETIVGSSSFTSAALVVTSEVPSALSPARPAPENSRQSSKRKAKIDGREGAFRTPVPPPVERINIGSRQDELDFGKTTSPGCHSRGLSS